MSSGVEPQVEPSRVDPTLVASSQETIVALVTDVRVGRATPIRRTFVQPDDRAQRRQGGPLAGLVRNRDCRGLLLYLLVMTMASDEPFNVRRSNAVWARALGLSSGRSGSEAVSKTWQRLRAAQLVTIRRTKRYADVTPLREDGSGAKYTYPEPKNGERYLRLPLEFWLDEWHHLDLAGIAMLLVLLAEKPDVVLPIDRVPEWYGISRSTAKRGFDELERVGLMRTIVSQRPEPLSPLGYTFDHHRILLSPFDRKARSAAPVRDAAATDVNAAARHASTSPTAHDTDPAASEAQPSAGHGASKRRRQRRKRQTLRSQP